MYKNYLKIAWRNLLKNKLYSVVNIIGLATGITACMLIGIYIHNELSYDRFHKNTARIGKAYMEYSFSGTNSIVDLTGTKVGPQLQREFSQIEGYVRTMKSARSVSNGTKTYGEKRVLYTDADFFKVFSFNLLRGNGTTALDAPQKVVLTSKTARKYFGDDDPVGKTLRFDGGSKDYEITGVVQEAPTNSQLQFDMLVSFNSLGASKSEIWMTANYQTYFLFRQPNQITAVNKLLGPFMQKVNRTEMQIPADSKDFMTLRIDPLSDVHLRSSAGNSFEPNGNMTYIYVLGIVGLLILLIACVNYTNLATARSASRGTEIGVRKVMGAEKGQLLLQFLGESFTITTLALVLAFLMGILLLPVFNSVTGKEFSVTKFVQPGFLVIAVAFAFLISVLAGTYPALILSKSKIVTILKSGVRLSPSGNMMRHSLITFQFATAIFLIVATLVVTQQMRFIQNKNMGYKREHVIVVPIDRKTKPVYDQLKEAFRNNSKVTSVTGAYEDPTSIGWGDGIEADNGNGKKQLSVTAVPVDLDYLKTMGMDLAAGRDFTKGDFALQDTTSNYANYKTTYILNEKAAKELGWTPEQALGQTVSRGQPGPVTGVVKDFHFQSLHEPIGPLVVFLDTTQIYEMYLQVKGDDLTATIASLENTWKSRVSHRPFDYHFLDDDFDALYRAESRTEQLFALFSGIAIILACLGLFALTALVTVQRTREIGVRKVLGASVAGIVGLLSVDFLKLVAIALVIAAPIAMWLMNHWLTDFAYRVEIAWWIPVLAGVFTMAITLLTVSFQAIKAALMNPVKSLKSE